MEKDCPTPSDLSSWLKHTFGGEVEVMSSISLRKRIGISCCLFFCVHKMNCNLAVSVVDGVTRYLYVQRKDLNTGCREFRLQIYGHRFGFQGHDVEIVQVKVAVTIVSRGTRWRSG